MYSSSWFVYNLPIRFATGSPRVHQFGRDHGHLTKAYCPPDSVQRSKPRCRSKFDVNGRTFIELEGRTRGTRHQDMNGDNARTRLAAASCTTRGHPFICSPSPGFQRNVCSGRLLRYSCWIGLCSRAHAAPRGSMWGARHEALCISAELDMM